MLFVVSIAAAIISTTGDSCALLWPPCSGHNIYQHIKPNASSQETLRVVRIATPIVTAIALCIALFFGMVYKLIIFTGAISLCTILPLCLRLLLEKANNLGSIASYFAGLISWVVIFFLTLPSTMEANVGILVEGEVYMEWAIWDALYISWCLLPSSVSLLWSLSPWPLRA